MNCEDCRARRDERPHQLRAFTGIGFIVRFICGLLAGRARVQTPTGSRPDMCGSTPTLPASLSTLLATSGYWIFHRQIPPVFQLGAMNLPD
jgi:hypothetical protein